jgi:hypothetical protein
VITPPSSEEWVADPVRDNLISAAQHATNAVRRSAPQLRPLHDRGVRSLAVFGAVPLLEDIEVFGVLLGADIGC